MNAIQQYIAQKNMQLIQPEIEHVISSAIEPYSIFSKFVIVLEREKRPFDAQELNEIEEVKNLKCYINQKNVRSQVQMESCLSSR